MSKIAKNIGNNGPRSLALDDATYAQIMIDYAHREIHAGSHFFVKDYMDVDTTTISFLWVTPDTAKWAHALWSFAGEAEFNMDLFEDCSVSANGTAITIQKNNRNSTKTNTVLAFSDPTIITTGSHICGAKIGSNKNATAGVEHGHEFIGKQNTKYFFRIVKVAANVQWFDYDFNWYEHTDKN